MGWRANTDVSGITAHQVRDLAGEAMAPPCVGMAILSLALAMPELWTHPQLGFQSCDSICKIKVRIQYAREASTARTLEHSGEVQQSWVATLVAPSSRGNCCVIVVNRHCALVCQMRAEASFLAVE
eukprot:4239535-Amphidinium_carterae.1